VLRLTPGSTSKTEARTAGAAVLPTALFFSLETLTSYKNDRLDGFRWADAAKCRRKFIYSTKSGNYDKNEKKIVVTIFFSN
jgi:hypothetical protein